MSLVALDWQSFYGWVAVSLFSGVLSFFSCIKALALAERTGMIAQPGKRQSHEVATPTGGGLGLIFSIIVTSLCLQLVLPLPGFWWQNMLPGILLLAIVGWRDDKFPVSSLLRLLVQLAVATREGTIQAVHGKGRIEPEGAEGWHRVSTSPDHRSRCGSVEPGCPLDGGDCDAAGPSSHIYPESRSCVQ